MIATEQDIDLLLTTILRHSRPERVYLFGSQGRNDARQRSDIDLLIIEPTGLLDIWYVALINRLLWNVLLKQILEHYSIEFGTVPVAAFQVFFAQ